MNLYAYRGTYELGKEPCGTYGKILIQHGEYKTLRGFLRYGIPTAWRGKPYRVYTFSNFYRAETFTLVFRNDA